MTDLIDSESDSSETNLVITTKKDRFKLFCRVYWRILLLFITPVVLSPVAFLGGNAYQCFYIFLVTAVFWVGDVLHPAVVSLFPISMFTFFGTAKRRFIKEFYVQNNILECLGVMMLMVAIEQSHVNRRAALKLLLLVGCSHYRLSFLLFFASMLLSMLINSTAAYGLMIPLVSAVLNELEKMGIIDVNHHNIVKGIKKTNYHDENVPVPTDFTVFYYLGTAYSSSIGGMATIMGSYTNKVFSYYNQELFPYGPKIDFPNFMLLSLPAVLLMEMLLYLWMNFYFLGMFRAQSEIALEIGMTQEEMHYIRTLLSASYRKLGRIGFHESTVGIIVLSAVLLEIIVDLNNSDMNVSSPAIVVALLLFVLPLNVDFIKFFKRRNESVSRNILPYAGSKTCLSWKSVRDNIHWSVLLIICGGCITLESLKTSGMTNHFETFFLTFRQWPLPALALVIIVFVKILAEFSSNSVAWTLLPHIARISVICRVNPRFLMLSATLASSTPFFLLTGCAPTAMACMYAHIPVSKMMRAGVGPSMISIMVTWFTMTVWSKAIWPDISVYASWADEFALLNKTDS